MLQNVRDSEVLRYLGRDVLTEAVGAENMRASRAEFLAVARPRVIYKAYALTETPAGICLQNSGVLLRGAAIRKLLDGCEAALLVAGTLGEPLDRAIDRAQIVSMGRGILLDAFGSAGIEQVLDDWQAAREAEFSLRGRFLTRRFSPGYADLPLDAQKSVLSALDAGRAIGLYLTGSLMLRPLKSVTAILGVSAAPQAVCTTHCMTCNLQARCAFRKDGAS